MRRRTITAVSGNYGRQPHIARSRVGFAQRGVPICLPPFDPLLVRRHDADSMPTRQFVRSWTGKLSFSRVEQLQILQLARTQDNNTFAAPLQRLSHITSDLQEGVMKTRMQPIGNAWNNLPRLVRDLANELGKKIDLVMLGADTELDRQVLELIKDPLTHMVRNSADHGLERPADRRAAGKP